MIIAQYKLSNIALAPDELCKAINKYTDHTSIMSGRGHRPHPPTKCDIVHCHNKIANPIYTRNKKIVLQYHSEPFQVHLKTSVNNKLVIAQYHATLPEYKNCKIVRNIIDFNNDLYKPIRIDNKIKIGFSPSRIEKLGKWHDKGYYQTFDILNKLQNKYNNVEVDIIRNVSLDECIMRKSMCNIIIDECVTKSYHRSGLEGLALGKMTICSIGSDVNKILNNSAHTNNNPFINIWIDSLEKELTKLIESNNIELILKTGEDSRKWMEKYWNPVKIVNEFIKIYESL